MMNEPNEVVLLTAAVRPKNVPMTSLLDPAQRRSEYERAIDFWADFCRFRGATLAVAETTGEEIEPKLPPPRWRFLPISVPDKLIEHGKGALEWFALDEAISKLSVDIAPSATVHKVTGRLTLANADKVLFPVEDKSIRTRHTVDRTYFDSRVFSLRLATWLETFRGGWAEVDDPSGRYFEHVLAHRASLGTWEHGLSLRRFQQAPLVLGTSGSTGAGYRPGMLRRHLSSPIAKLETTFEELAARKQI